jgi:hypothetical protein
MSHHHMHNTHVTSSHAYGLAGLLFGCLEARVEKGVWQKRPPCVAKETYMCGKRDLRVWQKRPTCVAKETYCGLFFACL